MKKSLAQLLIPAIVALPLQSVSAADTQNSINFGLGGLNPMPHCDATIYTVEYERQFSPKMAVLGRGSRVEYTSDDHDYLEDGTLNGVDLGVRYYRAGWMQGFYTGGTLGYWTGDWTFTQHRYTPAQREGDSDSHSLRLNIDLGYPFSIRGTNVSIMPEVNIGKFFSSSSCEFTAPESQVGTPCDQESDVDLYIFAGFKVGVAF